MSKYIALLRGINVGGNKIIKMQELKAMFESLGFTGVTTYIQSGNVVFEGGTATDGTLSALIGGRIKEVFGFDVSVIIRTAAELERTLANNPFPPEAPEDHKRLYVSFLPGEPSEEALEKLRPYEKGADKLRVIGKEMYVLYAVSASRSALFNVSFDKIFGQPVTARNWNTVSKLAHLCEIK